MTRWQVLTKVLVSMSDWWSPFFSCDQGVQTWYTSLDMHETGTHHQGWDILAFLILKQSFILTMKTLVHKSSNSSFSTPAYMSLVWSWWQWIFVNDNFSNPTSHTTETGCLRDKFWTRNAFVYTDDKTIGWDVLYPFMYTGTVDVYKNPAILNIL